MTVHLARTDLGRLQVSVTGTGPPVVLWHSLFVDSRSWGPLIDALAVARTVHVIDGPSHGGSDPAHRDFSVPECADAAVQALDELGLVHPIDWVGNAWGGHIGIQLAARPEPRVSTLVTIGTPVRGFTPWEKLTKGWPLVWLYQRFGAVDFLMRILSDSLLGAKAVASQPELAAITMNAFRTADRDGMTHAVRSVMLRRAGVTELLPKVAVPTLVLTVRDDVMGWRPDEATTTCGAIPDCRVEVVEGTGHISPLLVDADHVERAIVDFWKAHDPSRCAP